MRFTRIGAASVSLVIALSAHQGALAQESDADALMAMDKGALRNEIQTRFDAALAATHDPAVVNADDSRDIWANEAKAQCGIALGYLKSHTKDPTSIGKCVRASQLMQDGTRRIPLQPWAAQEAPPEICDNPAIIFFGFDIRTPPPEAQQVVDFIKTNYQRCNWRNLDVTGHADRSGSDAYNVALSRDRAENVANMLNGADLQGVTVSFDYKGESNPRVPTEDGVREPQNRRVEISVR
ncbi:OmpA family protein [Altererythrobacter sp.]|uniref:OmpA family protein n=1 Tax=Altererythrobacter sp. TaxID=1872480 RepID=UPI003D0179D9